VRTLVQRALPAASANPYGWADPKRRRYASIGLTACGCRAATGARRRATPARPRVRARRAACRARGSAGRRPRASGARRTPSRRGGAAAPDPGRRGSAPRLPGAGLVERVAQRLGFEVPDTPTARSVHRLVISAGGVGARTMPPRGAIEPAAGRMDTDNPPVTATLQRMQKRHGLRSRAGGRMLLVSMKKGVLSTALMLWALLPFKLLGGGERRSSLYCLLSGRTRRHWRPAPGAQVQKGRQAARRKVEPPGAGVKGWLLVSMCQIASVSFLAMSIWATLAPRWRPRRRLVRW
jgi:hypothetical protein